MVLMWLFSVLEGPAPMSSRKGKFMGVARERRKMRSVSVCACSSRPPSLHATGGQRGSVRGVMQPTPLPNHRPRSSRGGVNSISLFLGAFMSTQK